MITHRNEADTAKTMDSASARSATLRPGSKWKTQKWSLLPAWMSGIIEAVRMKSVAAARKEQVSRTLGRLPSAMTRPAPRSGARMARRSLMS